MKKFKVRKKYAVGGIVDPTDPTKPKVYTADQQKKFDEAFEKGRKLNEDKVDNPIYLKRATNEIVESNKLKKDGFVYSGTAEEAGKKLVEQRKLSLKNAKYASPWSTDEKHKSINEKLAEKKYAGLHVIPSLPGVVKKINDVPSVYYSPPENQETLVGAYPQDFYGENLENYPLITNIGGHEFSHGLETPQAGYENPLLKLEDMDIDGKTYPVYKVDSNLTPYALDLIGKNIKSKNSYFSDPTEVMASKRQMELHMEAAPDKTFTKPWKYGDTIEDEHIEFLFKPENHAQGHIIKRALLGENDKGEEIDYSTLTKEEKADLKVRYKQIMEKLADNNQQSDIHTAAYGGVIQNKMGFGGTLAPTLFDVSSNALMNLTGFAATNFAKALKEGEGEYRLGKPNTNFMMAMGGQVPNPNVPVEVEGGEHFEMPSGHTGEFEGPSHEQGGIPTELPEGTKVYSDRIEVNGKSMADRKAQRERGIKKLEKLLGKSPSDKFLIDALTRLSETAALEEQQDMQTQEIVNQQQAQQEQQQMMAGLMQDPAMMQQMAMMQQGGQGMMEQGGEEMMQGQMGYGGRVMLSGGTPPSGVGKMYYNVPGLLPNTYYQNDNGKWSYAKDGDKNWANLDASNNAYMSGLKNLDKHYYEPTNYPNPDDLLSPEEIQNQLMQENIKSTDLPRLQATGLNKTVSLNPNEKYLGNDNGYDVIGKQGDRLLSDYNTNKGLPTYPMMMGVDPINDQLQQLMMNDVPDPMAGKTKNVFGKLIKPGTKGKDGKSSDMSGYDLTRGDAMGLAGNLYGAVGPMMGTFLNRMNTPKNQNFFREYGAEGMKAMNEAQGLATINRDKQLGDIKLNENAAKRMGRNSARGVNTIRGLDTLANMQTTQGQNQAYNSYAQQMMGLLGQKGQMENQQDQMVMQGETNRDLADRQDLDQFYTNLVQNMTSQSELMQKTGRDFNVAQGNKDLLKLSSMYSRYGIGVSRGKNGELQYTYNGKTIDEQTAMGIMTEEEKKKELIPAFSTEYGKSK